MTEVASGPAEGDVAIVTADQNLHVFVGGVAQPVVPLVDYAAWVPGSDWLVVSVKSQPTIQGSTLLGYRALPAGGGSPVSLPACTDTPPQGLPGPAVAFACGHTLEIADLAAAGSTAVRTYPWTAGLAARSFTVDPAGRLVAAVLAKSCYVEVFDLASGQTWPGTYMAAYPNCPDALAWSPAGSLAIAAFPGVALWSPGHVFTLARTGNLHTLAWIPGEPDLFVTRPPPVARRGL